ncbi:MAG: hypothetical protein H8E85_04035 [Candidatus Marinimicrobia bacterium]|nr:hypothetical protein [Candidatus Neomarinimicrobiota bacterium]
MVSQENIWENAEDFIQSYFEPEEFYYADYVQRLRIIPNGNNENWQQKFLLENDRFQLGWRMDKSSSTELVQNKKGYLSVRANDYNIIIGNARIQTGNSLLFGSDYNSMKSFGNLLSPGKIRWNISPYLGSETSSNPGGIFILNNINRTKYYVGVESSAISSGMYIKGKSLDGMLVAVLPKEGSLGLSVSYHLKNNFVQFSGETALKSNEVAQYFQLFSNSKDIIWLGQFRLLPNKWNTISGRPATGFGKTSNETGVSISVRKKINRFTIYGWADMYWEVQNEFSMPIKSGDDFLTGFIYKKKGVGTFEMKARRKTIIELFNNNSIYNLQNSIKYYYTFTMKKMIILKWKSILLKPDYKRGELIQIQSLKYHFENWSCVLGAIYFNTDNWDSRLYLIEPGLKGEFRIQPYYLEGISIYSKVNWKVNDSNSLSFRYSTQTKINNWGKWEPEMGLQLDIVF